MAILDYSLGTTIPSKLFFCFFTSYTLLVTTNTILNFIKVDFKLSFTHDFPIFGYSESQFQNENRLNFNFLIFSKLLSSTNHKITFKKSDFGGFLKKCARCAANVFLNMRLNVSNVLLNVLLTSVWFIITIQDVIQGFLKR